MLLTGRLASSKFFIINAVGTMWWNGWFSSSSGAVRGTWADSDEYILLHRNDAW